MLVNMNHHRYRCKEEAAASAEEAAAGAAIASQKENMPKWTLTHVHYVRRLSRLGKKNSA